MIKYESHEKGKGYDVTCSCDICITNGPKYATEIKFKGIRYLYRDVQNALLENGWTVFWDDELACICPEHYMINPKQRVVPND
jgi:hypothetical protein